jgi:hypothetical protein
MPKTFVMGRWPIRANGRKALIFCPAEQAGQKRFAEMYILGEAPQNPQKPNRA